MSAPCPVFGFVVRVEPRSFGASIDAFVENLRSALEPHGLTTRRGASRVEYVVTREASQATDADRQLVAEWATQWTSLAVTVGDLVDLNDAA
jgi:hypothetical protein